MKPYQKLKCISICIGKDQHWEQLNQYLEEKVKKISYSTKENENKVEGDLATPKQKIKSILLSLSILKKIKLN